MIRTQISFDEALYAEAKRAAQREGISLSELCRRGLSVMLARQPRRTPWMRHAGTLVAERDASERVDDVVYGRESP